MPLLWSRSRGWSDAGGGGGGGVVGAGAGLISTQTSSVVSATRGTATATANARRRGDQGSRRRRASEGGLTTSVASPVIPPKAPAGDQLAARRIPASTSASSPGV